MSPPRRGRASAARGSHTSAVPDAGARRRRRPQLRGSAERDRAAPRRLSDRRHRHLAEAPERHPQRPRRSCSAPSAGTCATICRTRGFVLTDRIEAVQARRPRADLRADDRRSRSATRTPRRCARTCAAVVQNARAGQTLVLSSTAYVGSTRELLDRAARRARPARRRGRVRRLLAGAPRPGRRGARAAGDAARDRRRHRGLLPSMRPSCCATLCRTLHRVSSPEAAEMVKLYESTFRAVNIALAFEMADACRSHEARPDRGHRSGRHEAVRLHRALPLRGRRRPRRSASTRTTCWRRCASAAARRRSPRRRCASVAARPRRIAMRAHELLLALGLPAARRTRARRRRRLQGAASPTAATRPPSRSSRGCRPTGCRSTSTTRSCSVLQVDGEAMYGVDPDPRRDASGFGPEDYDLAIARHGPPRLRLRLAAPLSRRCSTAPTASTAGRRRFLPVKAFPRSAPRASGGRGPSRARTQRARRARTRATEDAAPRSAHGRAVT